MDSGFFEQLKAFGGTGDLKTKHIINKHAATDNTSNLSIVKIARDIAAVSIIVDLDNLLPFLFW